jgi:sulfur transfer complex TusBCD TusB component (DsrH family)
MAVDDVYTVSLLHMDGTDASTTFTDESGKTWTAGGNAQLDTAQKKFGTSSLLLDGTDDEIYTADHADFEFGSGDFTIDCQLRRATTGNHMICAHGEEGNVSNFGFIFQIDSSNKLYFGYGYGGSYDASVATTQTMTTGAWYHVAVVRNGSSLYLFQEGVQVNTTHNISTITINNSNKVVHIGRDDWGNRDYSGWIDEFRISKGIARWTANFTPPSLPYGFIGGHTAAVSPFFNF